MFKESDKTMYYVPLKSKHGWYTQGYLESTDLVGFVYLQKYTTAQSELVRGNYIHIIGNGQSDEERSNAHTLDWDGNAWFAGDVYIGSTSGANRDEGSKKLVTEEYVDE